jgi:very-short-patch-repair endonuclease
MPQFIEISITGRRPRTRSDLRVHHATHLDATTHKSLPVTTPLQTLTDLKDERAWAEALYLGLVTSTDAPHGAEPTRSELERKLCAALRAAGLARPLVNRRLGPYRPDFLWPEHRLVVETDGWAGHGHRVAFEDDRKRDAWLQAAGYKVLRFTWRQVMEEPIMVCVRIAQCTPHHAPDHPPAGG